jgi:hypothetical protein
VCYSARCADDASAGGRHGSAVVARFPNPWAIGDSGPTGSRNRPASHPHHEAALWWPLQVEWRVRAVSAAVLVLTVRGSRCRQARPEM